MALSALLNCYIFHIIFMFIPLTGGLQGTIIISRANKSIIMDGRIRPDMPTCTYYDTICIAYDMRYAQNVSNRKECIKMKHEMMKRNILCFGLSLALALETLPLPAAAANTADTAIDLTVAQTAVSAGDLTVDSAAVTAGTTPNGTQDGQDTSLVGSTDGLDVSGGDVSGGDIKTPEIVYSGTYMGLTWTIDDTGFLLVSGTYDSDSHDQKTPWWEYYYRIKSAKILAENVTNTSKWFYRCEYLTSVDFSAFDTSKVTDMSYMFYQCSSLTALDLRTFDTSNVTTMSNLFFSCKSLTSLDVSSFDTSKVTSMDSMFSDCNSLTSLDVSSFDTSQVKRMSYMFAGCSSLTSLDVSSFDTAKVEYMYMMFSSLPIKTLDLSNMDLSSLGINEASKKYTPSTKLFGNMATLEEIRTPLHLKAEVELPIYDSWTHKNQFVDEAGNIYTSLPLDMDTSLTLKPTTTLVEGTYHGMTWTFYEYKDKCTLTISGTYDPNAPEGEDWHAYASKIKEIVVTAKSVESMDGWFKGYQKLTSVDLTGLDASKITDMSYLFYKCNSLQTVDMSGLDTSHVTDMSFMFYNCSKLQTLDVSGFNTANVTNMSNMFYKCMKLEGLDLRSFDTAKVTDMSCMFSGCEALSTLDISSFNTAQVTDMSYMFSSFYKLKELDLSHFDTSALTTTTYMFYNCHFSNLKLGNWENPNLTDISHMFSRFDGSGLDLSGFHTAQVKTMSHLFDNCRYRGLLDLSSFDTAQVTDMSYLFSYCSAYGVDLHSFHTANVTDMTRMFYYCDINTLDLSSFDTSRITDMSFLFCDCRARTINLQSFDTSNVTYMNYMFRGCSCEDLDLSHFDTSNVRSIEYMFENADMQTLDLSPLDLSKVGNTMTAFNSSNIRTLRTPRHVQAIIDLSGGMTDIDGNCYYALPIDLEESLTLSIPARQVTPVGDQIYTGSAVKPQVRVFMGLHELTPGKDYKVSYRNNVHAAFKYDGMAPAVLIKCTGHYKGTITLPFTIQPAELTEDIAILSPSVYQADGTVQKTIPTITVQKRKLVLNRDFTVEFPDTAEGAYCLPGTYPMVIHGIGDYQGTINTTLTLLTQDQIPITQLKIGKIPAVTLSDGVPATPSPKITYQKQVLTEGVDYALSYKDNDKAGTATLTVTGLQNPNGRSIYGSVAIPFVIKELPLTKATVQYDTTATFTGKEICPAVTVSYQGKKLLAGEDYTISYEKNVNVGTAKIKLTGCGNYSGTVNKTFRITPLTASGDTVKARLTKGVAYYEQSGARPALTITCGDNYLKEKTDYTVTYTNNKQIAAADAPEHPTAIITGKGNYRFQMELPFSIVAKPLSDRDISIYVPDVPYKNRKNPVSKPIIKDGRGKRLKAGQDYTILSYEVISNDIQRATGYCFDIAVKIQGIGNYTGKTIGYYSVTQYSINRAHVYTEGIEYDGDPVNMSIRKILRSIRVYDSASRYELCYGGDFVVTDYKCKGRTITVTIRGCGDYGGQKKFTLKCIDSYIGDF